MTGEVRWLGADLLSLWPGSATGSAAAAAEGVRQDLGDLSGAVTTERRYYISSSRAGTDARAFGDAARGHWGVWRAGRTGYWT